MVLRGLKDRNSISIKTLEIMLNVIWIALVQTDWLSMEFSSRAVKQESDFCYLCASDRKPVLTCSWFGKSVCLYAYRLRVVFIIINTYTGCNRRNGPDFGRVFLMLSYTEKPQNTYIQNCTVWEIMASEVWNFDSCYTLTDYQIRIETGRNMWFL